MIQVIIMACGCQPRSQSEYFFEFRGFHLLTKLGLRALEFLKLEANTKELSDWEFQ